MARNIELKARLKDLEAARSVARSVQTGYLGVEVQTDTYFHCPRGRLKIREIQGKPAELIGYIRPDTLGERASDYVRAPLAEVQSLRAALMTTLGIRGTVRKRREIFLYDNIRIHLDQVERLGDFLEFEAVIRDSRDEANATQQLAYLREKFGVHEVDIAAPSYSDLLEARSAASR